MFSLRIVTVDYYLSTPVKSFDVTFSDFRGAEIYKVPVIRVFGVTPAGQKGCLHVHGVFPYLSVHYDDDLPADPTSSIYRKYSQELAYSIDKALNIASRKSNSNRHHVYKIVLESRIPFYGYHEKEQPFLKIFFYNPVDVKKTMELLSTGVIMNKVIQPYEAHIPYTLQFFIDYNLFGMNFINVDPLKFRIQHEICEIRMVHPKSQFSGQSCEKSFSCKIWDDNALKSSDMVSDITKQTSCELEADCCASYIMNHKDAKAKQGENPGLREIWEEEKQRRRDRKQSSQITPAESQERSQVFPTESDILYKGRLKQILIESKIKSGESTSNVEAVVGENTSAREEEINSSLNQDSMLYTQDKDMLSMVLSIINSESYHCEEEEDSILSCKMQKPDEKDEADETLEMSSIIIEEEDFAPECSFPVSASLSHKMCDETDERGGSTSFIKKSQELNNPPDSSPPIVSASEEEEDFKISQLDGTDDLDDFLKPKLQKSRKIPPLQLTTTTKEEKMPVASIKTNNLKKSKNVESDRTHAPLEDRSSCQALEYSYSQHSVSDSFNEGKKIMCLKKIGNRAVESLPGLLPQKQKSQATSPSKKGSDSTKPSSRLRRKNKYLPISGLETLSPSKNFSGPPKNNDTENVQNVPFESCKENNDDIYCSNSVLPSNVRRDLHTFDSRSDLKLCSTSSNNSMPQDAIEVTHTDNTCRDFNKSNFSSIKSNKLHLKSHKSRSHRRILGKAVETEVRKNKPFYNGNVPSYLIIPPYAKQFDLRKIGNEQVFLKKLALNNDILTSHEAVIGSSTVSSDSGISGICEREHTAFKSSTRSKNIHASIQPENRNDGNFHNLPQNSDDFHRSLSLKMKKTLNPYKTLSISNEEQNTELLELGSKKVCSKLSLKRKRVNPVKILELKADSSDGSKGNTTHSENRQQNCEDIIVASKKVLSTSCQKLSQDHQPPESKIPAFSSSSTDVNSDRRKMACNSFSSDDKTFSDGICGDKKFIDSFRNKGKPQPLSECQTLEEGVPDQIHSAINVEDCSKSCDERPQSKAPVLSFDKESTQTAVASDRGKQGMSCMKSKKQLNKATEKQKVALAFQDIQSNCNSHVSIVKLRRSTENQRQMDISSGSLGRVGHKKKVMFYSHNTQEQSKPELVSSSSTGKQFDTFSTKSGKAYSLKNCKVILNKISIEEEAKGESFSDRSQGSIGKTQAFQPPGIATDIDSVKPVMNKFEQLELLSLNFSSNSDMESNKTNQSLSIKLASNVHNKDEEYQDALYNMAFLSPNASYSDPSTSPPRCWSPNSLASENLDDGHYVQSPPSTSTQDGNCENLHLHEDKVTDSSGVATSLNNLPASSNSNLITANELFPGGDSELHVRCSFNKSSHRDKLDSEVAECGIKRSHSGLSLRSDKQDSVRTSDYIPGVHDAVMSYMEFHETSSHKSGFKKGSVAEIIPENSMFFAGSKEIKNSMPKDFKSQNILSIESGSKIMSEKNCNSSWSVNFVQNDVCVPNYILHDVQKVLDKLIISVDKIVNENAHWTISKAAKNCKSVPNIVSNSVNNSSLHNETVECHYLDRAHKDDFTRVKEIKTICKLKSKNCDFHGRKCISHKEEHVSISSSPDSLELFASSGSETSIENKQVARDSFQALSPMIDFSPDSTKTEISIHSSSEGEGIVQNVSTLCPCSSSKNVPFVKGKTACTSNEQPFLNDDLFENKNILPPRSSSNACNQVFSDVNNLYKTAGVRSLMVNSEALDVELQKNDIKNQQLSSVILEEKNFNKHSVPMAGKPSDFDAYFNKTPSAQNLNTKVPKLHFQLAENSSKLNVLATVDKNTICSASENKIQSSSTAKESMKAKLKCSVLTQNKLQTNAADSMEIEKTIATVVDYFPRKHGVTDSVIFEGELEVAENEDYFMGNSIPHNTSSDLGPESNYTDSHVKNISSEMCSFKGNENDLSSTTVQATNEDTVKETNINKTVSHEKSFVPLITNVPIRRLSENASFDNGHLEQNLTIEDSLCDEAPLQSFYNYQSLTLQNSCEWNDDRISTSSQSTRTHTEIKKSFVLKPKCKPPTREEVENSCELYGIPETRHQEAFFSNPLDIPGGKTLMGHIPRVKSTKTCDLLDFDTKFQTGRMSVHSTNLAALTKVNSSNPSSSFHLVDAIRENPEMKVTLAGNRLVVLTPACFPPSRKKVEEWVKLHHTKALPEKETFQNSETSREDNNMKLEEFLGGTSSRKSRTDVEESLKVNPEIVVSCVSDSSLKLNNKVSCHQEEISPILPLTTELNLTPNKSLMEYRHFKKSLHSVSTPLSQFRFKKFLQKRPSVSLQNYRTVKPRVSSNNNNSLCESPPVATSKSNSPLSPITFSEDSTVHSSKKKRKLFENNDAESMKLSPKECLKHDNAVCGGKILSTAADTFSEPNNSSCSQIDGPSYENTGNYKVNLGKIGDARSVHMNQYLTIMSVEIHVNTRNDLRPDPEHDAVCAVFYYIYNDVAHGHSLRQEILGVIVLDADVKGDSGVGSHSGNSAAHANTEAPLTADSLQGSKPCGSHSNNQSEPMGSVGLQDDAHISTCASFLKNSFVSKVKIELMVKIGVENVSVTSVQDEKMLFKELSTVVEKWDPDILVGYEIQMLSWGYLLQRASHLKINLLSAISRIQESEKEPVYDTTSAALFDEYGSEHSSEIHIDGRIVLNVWRIMRKEVTLNRYSFENVFYHVLHQRIPLYSFKTLTSWYNEESYMKQRVFDYYAIRTWGTAKLLDQLDVVARTSELARVFGIQFYDVLNRGSQFRVESMMLRCTKSSNYIPVSPTVRQRSSSRAPECVALIMEPESRFYTDPVVVLDFQSLYPSMIIAYNYCFSTCLGRIEHLGKNTPFDFGCTSLTIPQKSLLKLKDSIHFSPTGIAFVKSTVRQGILPQLLNEILTTRIMVKQSMKQESTDKTLKKLLDARQLGLKLIANVTYGYTSANYSGRMPCVEVADSIVGKARETLERAIRLVEDNPKWKARVVYGDTDSMFVLLPGRSKDQAFKIGHEIADVVTQANPKPVKLKFEKVYLPCVLQCKKHYVGFMYETPDQKDPVYDAKGIETVRRDTCPAVAKILEKSLKILFNTRDISLVKVYVQKQFNKLLCGRASIIDCIFAKEYRGLGGYRPGACVPALEIAKRRLRKDPQSEPRVGERVPYVIIYGFPTQPLIQLVKEPEELLEDKSLHINSKYYITRVIIPPLDRVFSLIGIDVRTWYTNMPHLHAPSLPVAPVANQARSRTLSQYFTALNCPVCDLPTNLGICSSCQQNPQVTCVILNDKVRQWERTCHNLSKICASCTKSKDSGDLCLSIDCPVMFRLNHAKKDFSQAPYIRNVLMLDFF